MRNRGAWIAFLSTCFALTGLVGLFASYGAAIPLERALYREEAMDAALAGSGPQAADWPALIGPEAAALLIQPGDPVARARAARESLRKQGLAEQGAVASRTRLMVVIVTVLCGFVGVGVLLIATRPSVTEG